MKRIKERKSKHRAGLLKRLRRDNELRRVPRGCHGIFVDALEGMMRRFR
jgi:hypothetical protein